MDRCVEGALPCPGVEQDDAHVAGTGEDREVDAIPAGQNLGGADLCVRFRDSHASKFPMGRTARSGGDVANELLQHRPHLGWRTGKQREAACGGHDDLPRGRASHSRDDEGAFEHVCLPEHLFGGARVGVPTACCFEAFEERRILRERQRQRARCCFAGHVVVRRPEPARGDDERIAVAEPLERLGDHVGFVADTYGLQHVVPGTCKGERDFTRVRVDAQTLDEFRAHREDRRRGSCGSFGHQR